MTLTANKNSLTLAAEALAHELKTNPSTEGRVSDMLSAMLGTAERVFNSIKDIFTKQNTGITFKPNDAYRKITATNFFDFSQKEVETAGGWNGNLVEYGTHVQATLRYYDVLDESLKYYTGLLGKIINSKEERSSWVDVTSRFTSAAKQRDQITTDTQPFWSGPTDKSITKIDKVIRRATDLHLLNQQAGDVASVLKGIKIQELVNRIDHVNTLANGLAQDVKLGKYEGITTAQVNNLSAGVLELANQAELFSTIVFDACGFIGMVTRLQEAANQVV